VCIGRGYGEHPVGKGRPGQRLSRRPWVGVLEAKGPSMRQRKMGLVRPGEPKWHTRKRRQPLRYGGLGAKPRLARRDYEFSALDHGLQRHPPRLGRVLTAGQWAILPVFGPKTRAFSLPGVQRYPTNSAMQALLGASAEDQVLSHLGPFAPCALARWRVEQVVESNQVHRA
jgi:hypothetical protein